MTGTLRKRLEFKMLLVILLVLWASFVVLYNVISANERTGLVESQRARSILMANTIHETLDKDMMAFRADMVRYLIGSLKSLDGVVRLEIIRGDAPYVGDGRGREAAFRDFKTLEEVRRRLGPQFRPEWEKDHPNQPGNTAPGTGSPEFRRYFDDVVKRLNEPGAAKAIEHQMHGGALDSMYFETIDDRSVMTYLRPLPNFEKCAMCHGTDHKLRGVLLISTDMGPVNAAITANQRRLIAISVSTVAALMTMLSLSMRRMVLAPVKVLVGSMHAIAEGEGDLTKRIDVTYADEVGEVAHWFNAFVEKLHRIVSQVRGTSREMHAAAEEVRSDGRRVIDGVSIQWRAIEDTCGAVAHMNSEIKQVAGHAESLATLAEESAVAILQMSATNEEITRSAALLSSSVEQTSEAILTLSGSVRRIDESVDQLERGTEGTATALERIDASIKDIQKNVHDAVTLSQEVAADAELGRKSVIATTEGIADIQQYSDRIAAIIGNLHSRTAQIGKILNVIDEVAEQTNLLALNAAIIAAQAGEHGKGFAVVAGEIKELAERTGVSTKEIQGIIRALQDEGDKAVSAIQRGSHTVNQGVRLSRAAGDVLGKILDSAAKSTQRVEEISRSSDEQTHAVREVVEAMSRVTELVHQIGKATGEQTRGSEAIIKTTAGMRDIAITVRNATQEQNVGNRQINEIVERVNQMVKGIADSTNAQAVDSENIVGAIQSIKTVLEEHVQAINRVTARIERIGGHSAELNREIDKFKL